MTLEQATQIESSQHQLFSQLQHEEAMVALGIENDYKLFSILKPQLFKVNDHWQCLYGPEGLKHFKEQIRGTGNTPRDAVVDWNNKWNKTKIIEENKIEVPKIELNIKNIRYCPDCGFCLDSLLERDHCPHCKFDFTNKFTHIFTTITCDDKEEVADATY